MDLKRFRATFTGDMLRQQYQLLSEDLHSLGNLGQDLPNDLQSQKPMTQDAHSLVNVDLNLSNARENRIPMFSLPQVTKSKAKIADLVNHCFPQPDGCEFILAFVVPGKNDDDSFDRQRQRENELQ